MSRESIIQNTKNNHPLTPTPTRPLGSEHKSNKENFKDKTVQGIKPTHPFSSSHHLPLEIQK